jgi:type VI secretion system protein ImpE
MDPKELIRAGKLSEARQQLIDSVKDSPGDSGLRVLLFQVLTLLGDFQKAERHIDIIAAQDVKTEAGIMPYKNLLHGEKVRQEVYNGERRPDFLPKTPAYAERYLLALEQLKNNEFESAEKTFELLEEDRPPLAGTVNDQSFADIRETDSFLSYFIEAFVHERYVWIPFEFIREMILPAPESLFDLIWIPARITAWSGLTLNCFLPVVYPESPFHEDDRIKMGRMTDWRQLGGPFYKGLGQHVFQIGENDVPLLEIRELMLNQPVTQEVAETGKGADTDD